MRYRDAGVDIDTARQAIRTDREYDAAVERLNALVDERRTSVPGATRSRAAAFG